MRFPIRHKVLGKIIWTYDVGIYLSHYCMPFLPNLQICSLVTLLTLNFYFWREFQLMAFTSDDDFLLLDQNTNQLLV